MTTQSQSTRSVVFADNESLKLDVHRSSSKQKVTSTRIKVLAGVSVVVAAGVGVYIWRKRAQNAESYASPITVDNVKDEGISSTAGHVIQKCVDALNYTAHVAFGTVMSKVSDKAHDALSEALDFQTYVEKAQNRVMSMVRAPLNRFRAMAEEKVEDLQHEFEDRIEAFEHQIEDVVADQVGSVENAINEQVEAVEHQVTDAVQNVEDTLADQVEAIEASAIPASLADSNEAK